MSKKAFFKKLLVAGLCAVTATATVGFVACKKDKDDDNKKNEQLQEWDISWDLDGGAWQSGKEGAKKVKDGEKLAKPENPTKSGKVFDKWVLKADGTTEYNFNSEVKAGVALKAIWKDAGTVTPPPGQTTEYTVTIDLDGGTWEGVTATVKVDSGKNLGDVLEVSDMPVKTGYDFAGFVISGTTDEFGIDTTVTGNVTIKATWTEKHEHTWAEAPNYTKDINGHWLAATCTGHEAHKKPGSEVPHVDANGDNVCDTCAYTETENPLPADYTALRDKTGVTKIVANTFLAAETLPTFGSYGSAGLYQPAPTATNYVEIKNGKASLVTPNENPATNMYVDFGNALGTVEGYFEISDMSNGLSGYTPVQFEGTGGTNTELFGLRADNTLKPRLDGTTVTTPENTITLSATDKYGINFVYNTITSEITLTVKVNGEQTAKAFVTDLKLNGSLTGIKFSTGSGNNKTFKVDNLVVVYTPVSVSDYKTANLAKVTAIEEELGINDPNGDATLIAAVNAAHSAYTASVGTAETIAAVDEAYAAYEDAVVDAVQDNFSNGFLAALTSAGMTYTTVSTPALVGNKEAYDEVVGAVGDATTFDEVKQAVYAAVAALAGTQGSEPTIKPDSWYNAADLVVNINYTTDSPHVANVTGLKVGDSITLEAVQNALGTILGYTIDGYYTDSGFNNQITTWPYTATTATPVEIYVKVTASSFNSSESWATIVAGSADGLTTQAYASGNNIEDNTLFTITATTGMRYSGGQVSNKNTYGNICNGSNAASYTNHAGTKVSPDQGIQLSSTIAKDGNLESAFTVTAKTKITLQLYVMWANDGYSSNKAGTIDYKINTGTVAHTKELTARKSIETITVTLEAGDVLTVGGTNTHSKDAGKIWLFGAEAQIVPAE